MKLISFLLLTTFLQAAATGFGQKNVTLNINNADLARIFSEIQKKTSFTFLYNDDLLPNDKKFDVNVSEQPLSVVLDNLFRGSNLAYKFFGNNLVVIGTNKFIAFQSQLRGIVKTPDGNPLAGVSVKIKGSSSGTSTGVDGRFALNAPENTVLVVSYVGYITQEVNGSERSEITIILQPANKLMDQVVMVGYGTQRKKDVTGSIVSVNPDDLPQVGNTSVNQVLQGRVPGLVLSQNSAQPGGGVSVNIRGSISPNGSNSPLYVIDGVPLTFNGSALPALSNGGTLGFDGGINQDPLNTLNPADIENITVLKDASATAIYGASAANGVILITTRKGKTGKASIEYNGSYTVQSPQKYFDLLDAKGFATQHERWAKERYLYDNHLAPYGSTDPSSIAPYTPLFSQQQIAAAGTGTNWLDQIKRNGFINEHNLSVSAGNENTKIFTSFNVFDNNAILKNSQFLRYSGRVNIEQRLGQRAKIYLNSSYTQINNKSASSGQNYGGAEKFNELQTAYAFAPNIGLNDASGNFTKTYNPQITNPLAFLSMQDNSNIKRIFFAPNLEINLLKGLKINITGGLDQQSSERKFYLPIAAQNYIFSKGMAQLNTSTINNYSTEAYLTFNKGYSNSSLNVVGGVGYYNSRTEGFGLQAVNFFSDAFGYNNVSVATDRQNSLSNSYKVDRNKVSQFLRINYTLADKYIITFNGRHDGESTFPVEKFGFFPGISAAWRINKESFLKNVDKISDLKIRVGYGTAGNDAGFSPSIALPLYSTGSNFQIGNTLYNGLALSQIGNNQLKWETDIIFNAGIDASLFNDRVILTYDYYRRTAKNLLNYLALPTNNPTGQIPYNLGTTRSVGHEWMLTTKNVTGLFNWSTTVTLATYNNTWIKRNDQSALPSYVKYNGPINALYGWQTNGLITSLASKPSAMPNALPGNIMYKDLNNDGKLDDKDVAFLGNLDPKWSFGFNNTFSYKGLDLNVFVYGLLKKSMTNGYVQFFDNYTRIGGPQPLNTITAVAQSWSTDNTNGVYPGIASNPYDGQNTSHYNDFYLQSVSFIRIKNITLGYRLPQSLLKGKNFIKGLRVFADVQNLGVITNYHGIDPEYSETNPYPKALMTTFGVNLSL